MSDDCVSGLRERVPENFRFPADRAAVTAIEIAEKWFVDRQQVLRVLDRERAVALNISSGTSGRMHLRVPIDVYYRITAKRLVEGFLRSPDEGPALFDLSRYSRDPDGGLPD